MVVYAIAAAGLVGSVVGAFFQVRWLALLWSLPIVCALYGAVVFAGPLINANPEAPEAVREAVKQLGDLSLLVPVLVAAAAGTLFASSAVRYMRSQQSATGLEEDERPRREPRPIFSLGRASDRLAERTEDIRLRRAPAPPRFAPLPVYEVVPEPSTMVERPPAEPAPDEPGDRGPLQATVEVNRRGEGRRRTLLSGELLFEDDLPLSCTIVDLSTRGARIRLATAWPKGRLRSLLDLSNGLGHEVTLRWRAGPFAGLRFTRSYSLQPRDA